MDNLVPLYAYTQALIKNIHIFTYSLCKQKMSSALGRSIITREHYYGSDFTQSNIVKDAIFLLSWISPHQLIAKGFLQTFKNGLKVEIRFCQRFCFPLGRPQRYIDRISLFWDIVISKIEALVAYMYRAFASSNANQIK